MDPLNAPVVVLVTTVSACFCVVTGPCALAQLLFLVVGVFTAAVDTVCLPHRWHRAIFSLWNFWGELLDGMDYTQELRWTPCSHTSHNTTSGNPHPVGRLLTVACGRAHRLPTKSGGGVMRELDVRA